MVSSDVMLKKYLLTNQVREFISTVMQLYYHIDKILYKLYFVILFMRVWMEISTVFFFFSYVLWSVFIY